MFACLHGSNLPSSLHSVADPDHLQTQRETSPTASPSSCPRFGQFDRHPSLPRSWTPAEALPDRASDSDRERFPRLAAVTAATTTHSVAPKTRLKIRWVSLPSPGREAIHEDDERQVHEYRDQHALGTVVDPHHEHPVGQQKEKKIAATYERRRDSPTGRLTGRAAGASRPTAGPRSVRSPAIRAAF